MHDTQDGNSPSVERLNFLVASFNLPKDNGLTSIRARLWHKSLFLIEMSKVGYLYRHYYSRFTYITRSNMQKRSRVNISRKYLASQKHL